MGPSHSSSLHIGGDSPAVSGSGVVLRKAPRETPFPLDKGKGKIDEVKYPRGSEYLKSAVQNTLAVGPSSIEPSYGATFVRSYRLPLVSRSSLPIF